MTPVRAFERFGPGVPTFIGHGLVSLAESSHMRFFFPRVVILEHPKFRKWPKGVEVCQVVQNKMGSESLVPPIRILLFQKQNARNGSPSSFPKESPFGGSTEDPTLRRHPASLRVAHGESHLEAMLLGKNNAVPSLQMTQRVRVSGMNRVGIPLKEAIGHVLFGSFQFAFPAENQPV